MEPPQSASQSAFSENASSCAVTKHVRNLSGTTSDLALKLKMSMKEKEELTKVDDLARELQMALDVLRKNGGNDDASQISALNDGKEAIQHYQTFKQRVVGQVA